eukprot:6466609-Amphidinium_carterae.1
MIPKGLQANKKTLALQLANFCFNQWSARSPRGHSFPIVDKSALCHVGAGSDSLPRFDASVSRLLSALDSATLSASSASGSGGNFGSNRTSGSSCSQRQASPALSQDYRDRRDSSSQALPLTQIDEDCGREVVLESPIKKAWRVTPIKMNRLRATKDQQLDGSGSLVT